MKKITLFIFLSVFCINLLNGQILEYNFNTSPYISPSSVDAAISGTQLSISSGSIDTDQTTGTYFTDEPYIGESGGWGITDVTSAKFFSFTITAIPGKQFSITNISFDAYATSAGPSAISILFNNSIIDTSNIGSATLQTIDTAITEYNNLTELSIKIACWDNDSRETSGAGIFRMDDLVVSGTVSDIPPNDSTSSIELIPGSVPASLSSVLAHSNGINIANIVVTDSASGDTKNTIIDEFIFIAGTNNEIANWNQCIDSAKITGYGISSGLKGAIKPDSLIFNTSGLIDVPEDTANQKTYELYIWLNDTLNILDNRVFEFYTDSTLIKCNSLGSAINYGKVNTGVNNLSIEIEATEIHALASPENIYSNSSFTISALATDSNGNIDTDYSEALTFSSTPESNLLTSPDGFTTTFNNGIASFENLQFAGSDTLIFNFESGSLFDTLPLYIGHYLFADNFESNSFAKWSNIADWTVSGEEPISGTYSLKHNLNDTAASSFISAKYADAFFNNGRTIWQLSLKNGDFNPTSSNKFWYYLMASDDSLTQESISGYVVGVNFSGSTDTLSLWRKDADGTKDLICQSFFEWSENITGHIKIIRDVPGLWQIGFSSEDNFSNMTYSTIKTDTNYSSYLSHGLVYNYTTTRAGLLWCDNLNMIQMNTAPKLLSAAPENQKQVVVKFSENIQGTQAVNTANYTISSNQDLNISIDSIGFNTNKANQVSLFVSELITASYTITISNLKDIEGLGMEPQEIPFSYLSPGEPFNIVINEIMADPNPTIDLPECDFLELYNSSEFELNLNNWELYLGTTKKTLPDVSIKPDSFLIVCQYGYYSELSSFGKTIELLSSSNLTISDRSIVLKNAQGIIIDSILYKKEWYNNPEKEDGGWSLERIDPLNTCSTTGNWSASNNDAGGTPGTINSIYTSNIDNQSPELTYAEAINSQAIKLIFSEHLDAKNISEQNFSLPSFTIDSVYFNSQSVAIVAVSPAMTYNSTYDLSYSNIVDPCGNSTTGVANFQYNSIEKNDVCISEIMVDPSPVIGLPEFEFIEITNNSNKTLNLENWIIEVNEKQKTLPRLILSQNDIVILCSESAAEALSIFGETTALPGFSALPNTGTLIQLLDTNLNHINSVKYSDSWYNDDEKQEGGWSLEKIDLNNACSGISNWSASINPNGGTPGSVNSINGENIDNTAPKIKALAPISDSALWISFSESVPEEMLSQASNFYLLGNNQAYLVEYDTVDFQHITLKYNFSFVANSNYTMHIANIADICGNAMSDTNIQFTYNKPQLYQLVINEIMANPVPSVGLPEAEYIELYNSSDYNIYMFNWYVSVGNSTRVMPYTFFPSKSYLLLCKPEADEILKPYGQVVSVENLPALPLSGEISIKNKQQQTLCISNYTSNWINDDFKADGGYSLERIDFNNPNETQSNWQVSYHTNGGTPGTVNSVYKTNPDSDWFNLVKAVPQNDSVVLAVFNKPIKADNTAEINISINPESGSIKSLTLIAPYYNSIKIVLTEPLNKNILYTIEVDQDISDLSGNLISNYTDNFMLAEEATENQIVINEVLFNPFNNGADFVELYNRSNKSINLSQLIIATRDENYAIKSPNYIAPDGEIMLPGEYRAISENCSVLKEQYTAENELALINISSMPTMANDEGTVVLMDTTGIIIDEFTYNENMHFSLLDDTKGISLERINFDQNTQDKNNWHSAAESSGWGTPGYKNSVFKDDPVFNSPLTVEPEAFSPDNDGYNDFLNVYYELNEPGYVGNIKIFDKNGILVKKLINNELLADSGVFIWDGTTDDNDKALVGIYVILFETFDLNGNLKAYKRTCVVASKI